VSTNVRTTGALDEQLYEALIHFDEVAAREVMQRGFALYSVDQVLMQVVQPVLVTIGEAWHRGELPIAVEHFATQFAMQHLMSLLAAASPPSHPGSIVAACAPGELHQIGLLSLVVLLRWRGWDVKYLGPDLPLERLEESLRSIRPQILMFSANRVETARNLLNLPKIFDAFSYPLPVVVLGGLAFRTMQLPASVPAVYLSSSLAETVQKLEEIMLQNI
jgi:methanogenic corrinoid protein MtbC1